MHEKALCLLNREESLSLISGIRVSKFSPSITHIFFADDSLVFFKATPKECSRVKNVLKTYEQATAQMINLENSVCMLSKNIQECKASELSRELGVEKANSFRQYLGLPAQTRKSKLSYRCLEGLEKEFEKPFRGGRRSSSRLEGKKFYLKR